MDIKYRHILNSAGTLNYNDNTSSNVVRGGIILYGILPCEGNYEEFRPVMKVKSKVLFMKKIKEPKFISYQKKYLAQIEELIATIVVSFSDFLSKANCSCLTINCLYVPCFSDSEWCLILINLLMTFSRSKL